MRCPICGITTTKHLCQSHDKAYQNLVEAYKIWNRALDINWYDYLREVNTNPYSGKWVKETCVFLLQDEEEKSKA